MKIKNVLLSCNSNPTYLDFWPITSKIWKQRFNIHPILIYIDHDDPNIDENFGTVIKMKPLQGISVVTQSQFARLWHLQFYPDDICITSDMDLLPISHWFFKTQIKDIDSLRYVITSIDGGHINIMFNIALGRTFKEYLDLKDNWEDQLNVLNDPIYRENNQISWSADEIFLTEKLKNKPYLKLERDIRSTRIDRSNWNYSEQKLKLGMYYDCHSLRPYNQYKNEIDKLINQIL